MSQLAVNPALFVHPEESGTGPIIAVVVSLTFPGITPDSHCLMTDFTRVAFESVRAAGGIPRLVDSAAVELMPLDEVLREATGILFLGGGDVDGALYGHTGAVPNSYGVDRRADDYCIALIREAVNRDLPTLAICRGSQLLNVAFGGTLIPDITDFTLHRGGPGQPVFLDKEVVLAPASHLANLLGAVKLTVRSGHHQAVDRVGEQLRPTALAHDGVVEGTEHVHASWVVGMQWHPEALEADPVHRELIFGELVERADRVADARSPR